MSWTPSEMKRWLPTLLSELHRSTLKSRGYRKQGKTFVRDCGSYLERYNFQGSMWNGTGVKWRFYLNVGLEFPDLEPERYWSYFANTHWAARVETIMPDAPAKWDYSDATDREQLKQDLAQLIRNVSELLKTDAGRIREQYIAQCNPRIPNGGV